MNSSHFAFHVLRLLLLAILLLLISAVGVAHAQSGGGYDLTWNTTDCGGATYATGGGYELGGTIGQPDAGSTGESPTRPYSL